MRSLKFRAWHKIFKNYAHIKRIWLDGDGNGHDEIFAVSDAERTYSKYEVILEQYTGLNDKNGKEIYEGDIVKLCGKVAENKCSLYRVFWESAFAGFCLVALEKDKYDVGYLTDVETESRCKVIGNIHENPELLEQEDAKN